MVIRADAGPSAALAQAGQAGGASLSLIGGFASSAAGPPSLRSWSLRLRNSQEKRSPASDACFARRESFDTWLWEVDYVKNLAGVDHVDVGTDLFGLRSMTLYLRTGSLGWLPRTC